MLRICLVFFITLSVNAVEWRGVCIAVTDGDTITVMYHELPLKVRLYGIDAPEKGQDHSRRAREYLAELVHRKTVEVEFMGFDRYNRAIGVVSVGEFVVNREMLAAGYAWVYLKYCDEPYRSEWRDVEANARARQSGLWSQPNPVPPWDFRKGDAGRQAAARTSRGN